MGIHFSQWIFDNFEAIYKILKTDYIYLPSSTARIDSKLEDKYLKGRGMNISYQIRSNLFNIAVQVL